MRLLVTGCARSGTGWLAACLTAAGVPCGHEDACNVDGLRTHGWVAESSWLAAPLTGALRIRGGVHVVHLVRHPLDVVRSNAERGMLGPPEPNAWGEFAIECCPWIADGADRVERAARYWTAWNRLVDADEVVRVEDVTAATVTRLARLVDPGAVGLGRLLGRVNAQDAGLRGADLADVPVDWALADRFGYAPRKV